MAKIKIKKMNNEKMFNSKKNSNRIKIIFKSKVKAKVYQKNQNKGFHKIK